MEIDKAYDGREHSLIKHELLKGYLEVVLSIVGVSGIKKIAYVDCFAGPWGDDTDSLAGTSIAISLEILAKVRDTLESVHGIRGLEFRAIYVEAAKRRYQKLSDYLDRYCPQGIQCHALRGDYSALQDDILKLCGEQSFAFFFVDPMGWVDAGIPKLAKLLRRPKSEFLITFMYDFLNRAIGMADYREQVSQMLGKLRESDYEQLERLSPRDRAEWVVGKYRDHLKASMGPDGGFPSRAFHADVLNKASERVHYHLVYLTRHYKGIVKFAEASEKVNSLQKIVRAQKKLNSSDQRHLFSAEQLVEHESGSMGYVGNVKAHWLEKLTKQPARYDEARLASMIEETGWLPRDFQDAFRELEGEKKVENLDGNPRRTKNFIHFDKGERLRRLV
jgi:three-Cys-motif partner protein